jgi:hypothetical protein
MNISIKQSASTPSRTGLQPDHRRGAVWHFDGLLRYGILTLFFGFFFAFLLWYIDPAVIYSSNGINIHNYVAAMHAQEKSPQHTSSYADPIFRRQFILELTPEYFREIAAAPGGWSRLSVTLCIYACHFPIAGALIITCLAFFFFWIFFLFMQGISGKQPLILAFSPPLFILTICAWYELNDCIFLLPVAGALVFTVVYQRFRHSAVIGRVLFLSALFWTAWYLFQWGCLLVLCFIIIHHFFREKRGITAVACASAFNGAVLLAIDGFIVPFDRAIRWSDFTELHGLPLVVIVFFPIAAIVIGVWGRVRRAPEGNAGMIGAIIQTVLLMCATSVTAAWWCNEPVNRDTRTIARTLHHSMNGKWEAILREKTSALFAEFPKGTIPLQVFMTHAADRALCRTGQLGDLLFSFPQTESAIDRLLMLESTQSNGYVNWIAVLDAAMDLGMINLAEKIAGEIMENVGPFPDILYRRSLIQIAMGNMDAAAVYLNKLAGMPFYRAAAKRLLGMLGNNAGLLAEPRVASMHANKDTVDYLLYTASVDAMFKHLLQSNPGNKAAYDYLMTYCILNDQLEGITVLSPAAPAFGYAMLPRCWEEGLCYYRAANAQQQASEKIFFGLRQETVNRFYAFSRAYSSLADDPAAAAKLAAEFGDSYFYFSVFKHSRRKHHE